MTKEKAEKVTPEQDTETVDAVLVTEPEQNDEQQLVTQQPKTLASAGISPMTLIQRALQDGSGASVEQLERLYALQVKYEENEAKKAFNKAIAEFKAKNIMILKKTNVNFSSSQGKVDYNHATLGDCVEQVIEDMSASGLSHSWDITQAPNLVTVTCEITHSLGHSRKVTMSGEPEGTKLMNALQKIASTVTYLSRYTLLAALGLATHDNDGRGDVEPEVDVIDENQLANLEVMIEQSKADEDELVKFLKIDALIHLPKDRYNFAVKCLQAKIDRANKGES